MQYFDLCLVERQRSAMMAAACLLYCIVLAVYLVSAFGCEVESATYYTKCDTDLQCDKGYFCYESHLCSLCMDCASYRRKKSWRSCAKIPHDCGACIQGYEEEILHHGKTREMCVPSVNVPLEHTVAADNSYERYYWSAGILALVLPIVYYVFCRTRDRVSDHRGLSREEPPPYRSVELTTLNTSHNSSSSEEILAAVDHELRVRQQKDSLVQAVPFCLPSYESEILPFHNHHEANQAELESSEEQVLSPPIDLNDENTMPSNWTPSGAEGDGTTELVNLEPADLEVLSDGENTCEPAAKRRKNNNNCEEPCRTPLNINLYISNNVTIHKQP